MTFQFYCPQGHLLEGEANQMGQQCNCPTCGTVFIIPTVETPAAVEPEPAQPGQFDLNSGFAPAEPQSADFPSVTGQAEVAANPFDSTDTTGARLLHIPCPDCGQHLETPEDMIGQEVICPFCGGQFPLRHKDSVEYKRERDLERERRERQVGKMWFNWAIAIAVVVVLGLVIMIATVISGN